MANSDETQHQKDDHDIALSITVLSLLRLLNGLLQLAHELDTTLRPDSRRTVYVH